MLAVVVVVVVIVIQQGVALMGHNHTGPPCSVDRPNAHAPGSRPAHRQHYKRRRMTNDDRHQQAKQYWPIKRASNNSSILTWRQAWRHTCLYNSQLAGEWYPAPAQFSTYKITASIRECKMYIYIQHYHQSIPSRNIIFIPKSNKLRSCLLGLIQLLFSLQVTVGGIYKTVIVM